MKADFTRADLQVLARLVREEKARPRPEGDWIAQVRHLNRMADLKRIEKKIAAQRKALRPPPEPPY